MLWREALAGAAACSLVLWFATTLFTSFLASGVARYNLVYGSLGTLLALMSWVYVASLLVLCGAHLAAAIAAHTRQAVTAEESGRSTGGSAVESDGGTAPEPEGG